ncbi:MAG: abortive phage infection protein [Lentihominibacter sp.]
MTKYEIMDSIVEQNNGYLLTSLVQDAGVSRTYMLKYVKDREMEQLERGIYILPSIWPDSLYVLQIKNKGAVFSNETALYLHGLMENEPSKTCVSVKRGYNATHLIKRGVKTYYVKEELFDVGVIEIETPFGNNVRVYDIDRTICDMVRRKKETDIQVFQTALTEYMSGSKKNVHRLMAFAKLLGIEDKIRNYTEVML